MEGVTKTRAFLNSRVTPALFVALTKLDAARPQRPLLFLAKELESADRGASEPLPATRAGDPAAVDMFAYVNGAVRDELLDALKFVGTTQPREPLKCIAERLKQSPAWVSG